MNFSELNARLDGPVIRPLTVAYGMGVDSTAMLIALARRYKAGQKAARPDLILFADTGGEKDETYDYEWIIQDYLASVDFPPLITVRYCPKKAHYKTLEENCLVNATLPSLAFGYKKCSLKWKRQPQDKYMRSFPLARQAWANGMTVIKCIGYDAGPKDMRRSNIADDAQYHYWYPLRELGWVRERCIEEIEREGLPAPMKSACFFCPSTKPYEIEWMEQNHPDLCDRIIRIEEVAMPNLGKVQGLWRTATKTRPGSMTEYIELLRSLPQEVEACESCSETCF